MADLKEQHVCIKFCFTMGEKMLLKLLENGQWEEHIFLSDFPSLKAV
jgi:hypothetical protein